MTYLKIPGIIRIKKLLMKVVPREVVSMIRPLAPCIVCVLFARLAFSLCNKN